MITHPTQNQQAVQALHKWVGKVAANANTAELDALELFQLQRLLGVLIGTYKTDQKFISVPFTGLHITENNVGQLNLQLPVMEEEGTLSLPVITIDPWFEHKLTLAIQLIPTSGLTFGDASELVFDLIRSIHPSFETSYKDVDVNSYLKAIKDLVYQSGFTFIITLDFNTGLHVLDVKLNTGLPKVEVPGISDVVISAIVSDGASFSSTYLFDDEDNITEVGFEYGVDEDSLVEVASALIESPFTATLDTLLLETQYIVTPYVKYGDNKMQRGSTATFVTLAL